MENFEGLPSRNGLYGFEFRDQDKRRCTDLSERKVYDIKQLWQRSYEIINLSAQGFKNVDIARILHCTPETVSNTLNGELGQRKLSEIRRGRDDEAKVTVEKIRVLTDKALEVYHEMFENESGEVSLKDKTEYADKFLDKFSGLKAPTRVQTHSVHTTLSAEELASFKSRGLKAAGLDDIVIDPSQPSESSCSTVEEITEDITFTDDELDQLVNA